jgi:hypothetical protein
MGAESALRALLALVVLSLPLVRGIPVQESQGGARSGARERELVVAVRSRASQADFDAGWARRGFGRDHLSLQEVCELFGPHSSSVVAVHQWAALHGATRVVETRFVHKVCSGLRGAPGSLGEHHRGAPERPLALPHALHKACGNARLCTLPFCFTPPPASTPLPISAVVWATRLGKCPRAPRHAGFGTEVGRCGRCADFILVQMPEDRMAAAFAGAPCECELLGACACLAAGVPKALSQHVCLSLLSLSRSLTCARALSLYVFPLNPPHQMHRQAHTRTH